MKLADLFRKTNTFDVKGAVKELLLAWNHDHSYFNNKLIEINNELVHLTKMTDLSNPTQEDRETYNALMAGWNLVESWRKTNIEVMGINIARLHFDEGVGLDQIHQAMEDVFEELGIPAEYWEGECFNPHALVAQMVLFEKEQRHIAEFIDDVPYDEAVRAVGAVLGEGGITKEQAVHTCRVIRRCYESHERAKELMRQNQEAMKALIEELMVEQAAKDKEGATIH